MYPENWSENSGIDFHKPEEVYAYLVELHEGWNPVFFTLFKACSHFAGRPLNYFPLAQRWKAKSNLTLLGDAAHLMPPNGEGVNLAMLDALDLSECMTSDQHEALADAIKTYEDIMITRAAALSQETLEGIEDFASPSDESIRQLIGMLSKKS